MSENAGGEKCDTKTETDTPPKRTRRHLLNEKVKSNTISRKHKSTNKATPASTNGQSRRHNKASNKRLANNKFSNSLESQHNPCMNIKVEPLEDRSEKSSEHLGMIEINFKHERTEDSESNDPLDVCDNVHQVNGLGQALPPSDRQELCNGKHDTPCKPQENLIYNTEEVPVSQGLDTPVHPQQIGMWQPRLAVSHDQIMALLAALQENPEAARGFSRLAEGRRRNKRFWTQLARTLNAVRGGAHKNADGWAKYWQDKKRNVKASVARREAACPTTGGGDQEVRTPLTDVEQRVVAIMGGLAYAGGDAQRIPVFCGEGPRNSTAAAVTTPSTSDDNIMLDPRYPSMWLEEKEDSSFAQPDPLRQTSPLPSPPFAQSAQRPPPSQIRNVLKSTVSETRLADDDNLALLQRQHEEKMAIERERNRLLSQLVEKVDKAVGMLGEVLSRIPR